MIINAIFFPCENVRNLNAISVIFEMLQEICHLFAQLCNSMLVTFVRHFKSCLFASNVILLLCELEYGLQFYSKINAQSVKYWYKHIDWYHWMHILWALDFYELDWPWIVPRHLVRMFRFCCNFFNNCIGISLYYIFMNKEKFVDSMVFRATS